MALLREMVAAGEIEHLVPERVWAELERALTEPRPSAFIRVLRQTGALAVLFPEIDRLYGVPQQPEHHPEIDVGIHQELVSDMAAAIAPGDSIVGYAALLHDLGKGITPPNVLPAHIGHEQAGLPLVDAVNARLKVPREHAELARLVCRHHLEAHRAAELRPGTLVDLLMRLDAFRRPERFERFLQACEADKRGRLGRADRPYPQAERLRRACAAAAAAEIGPALTATENDGATIARRVRDLRIAAIVDALPE